jgi:DNA invertase Pin-like site-specific DNA recombinase
MSSRGLHGDWEHIDQPIHVPGRARASRQTAFVSYLRVSTDRQGQSGLGLEAQRDAVDAFVVRNGGMIVTEFVEVESGKKSERPKLSAALAECRRLKAKLLIAKLDRLSRNLHFISGLMEGGVDFIAVDNEHATKLMIHLLAAFAEHERLQISERTKSALRAAKARGVVLGRNGVRLAAANRVQADIHAHGLAPLIAEMRGGGISRCKDIASALNARGVSAARGGKWYPSSVSRLLIRIGCLNSCK